MEFIEFIGQAESHCYEVFRDVKNVPPNKIIFTYLQQVIHNLRNVGQEQNTSRHNITLCILSSLGSVCYLSSGGSCSIVLRSRDDTNSQWLDVEQVLNLLQ